ncbi:hypothetical protein [Pararhodospirillum oryzae]|uniref:Uncharacterized protein n=1 Tax=Pararhodospirillum oryzae TaxID=478448 RepID=A0A512H650_9PROT|nr:hypothetical protein [Pararhodospirillum oryzae]GEO80945.1 hypothetical protein ROR02_10760 [Pararhodospirillum oryzae]
MPRIHYSFSQHMTAFVAVIMLSALMAGALQMGEARLGGGLQTPLAGTLGGIQAPSSPEWGNTVLRLSGLH